jgi:carbonic anhydrase
MRHLIGILVTTAALAAHANEKASVNPEVALTQLLEGNTRYVAGKLGACGVTTPALRQQLANGQSPKAIVISCSDSRVPPELVFDEGPGQLFVVRVAGNVVDPIVLGSVEYAAEHLGSPLIVVLGHERCGAVTAAVKATGHVEGNIGAIVSAISPAVESAKKAAPAGADAAALVEASMLENVKRVAHDLTAQSPVIAELVHAGRVQIVTARYDLDDGKVTLVDGKIQSPSVAAHH